MERGMKFWVMGGDQRQTALARLLAEDGHRVHTFALAGAEDEQTLHGVVMADCVILPLPAEGEGGLLHAPLSREGYRLDWVLDFLQPGQLVCAGMVKQTLTARAEARGLVLRDYFAREELAVANAVPTAEGAVQIALEELPITLHQARVLVIGYGRVGRAAAQRMAALGARVTVAARRYEQLAWAEVWGYGTQPIRTLDAGLGAFDLVVNTVPTRILNREQLSVLQPGTLVIDLASRPGGVDLGAAEELEVKTVWALSLPGRVAPVSAAGYIKTAIYHIIDELGE